MPILLAGCLGDGMQQGSLSAFETFLVEDVILTLGNLRGTLDWLERADSPSDAARLRGGMERIARQIALLEDRARQLCRARPAASPLPISPPEATAPGPSIFTLDHLLRDAGADRMPSPPSDPCFRTTRVAGGARRS